MYRLGLVPFVCLGFACAGEGLEDEPALQTTESALVSVKTNWAQSATAHASSIWSSTYAAWRVNDGNRAASGYTPWHVASWEAAGSTGFKYCSYPPYYNGARPYVYVDFGTTRTVGEVDVFSVQDNYANPSTPTLSMTKSLYGLFHYKIYYLTPDRSQWQPLQYVTWNDKVWNRFTFSPIQMQGVLVETECTDDPYMRVAEIEAWEYPDCATACDSTASCSLECQSGSTITTCGAQYTINQCSANPEATYCSGGGTCESWLATYECNDSNCPSSTAAYCYDPARGDSTCGIFRELEREEPLNLTGATPGRSRTGAEYEYDMTSGRLNKVPVSWVYSGVVTQGGGPGAGCCGFGCLLSGARVDFRATCVNGSESADTCDPALFVYWNNMSSTDGGASWSVVGTGTAMNNDAPTSLTQTTNARDSYVSATNCSFAYTRDYYVQAYSAIRGTSHVNVQYRVNGGAWTDAFRTATTRSGANPPLINGSNQHVGGTMVRVGPVQASDYIMLMSPTSTSGTGPHTLGKDSRMWVFNPVKGFVGSGTTDASGNRWSGYLSSAWAGGSSNVPSETYALLSLSATNRTSGFGNAGWVEKYYDLVHAPLSVTTASLSHAGIVGSGSRQSGYCPSVGSLAAGHYEWNFSVTTSKPVGSPTYKVNDPNPVWGTPNELAFRAVVKRGSEVMATRYVTRGAIGTNAPNWSMISLELVVPDEPAYAGAGYSVCFDQIAPYVSISGSSSIVRNQDSGELRVATANMEYWNDAESAGSCATNPSTCNLFQSLSERRNAIDLLGRSADYPGDGRVLNRDTRGRWRFDADLINFNEMLWDHNEYTQNDMRDRLTANTGYSYNFWNASSAPSRFCRYDDLAGCLDRMGILLQNPRARPNGSWLDGTPIFREPQANFDAACSDAGLDTETSANNRHACRTKDLNTNDDYLFVMRSAVNRVDGSAAGGYSGAPVMTVHLYYDSQGDSNGIHNRAIQTQRVIAFLEKLMLRDPHGFNTAGSTDPLHPGNRIILVGDSNLLNTDLAELNHHLVMLRDAFGYAVDPGMASTDNNGDLTRANDTHYGALPLMDARMLSVTNAAPFMTKAQWRSQSSKYRLPGLGDLDFGGSAVFQPWWVAGETGYTTNYGGGGDRHDVVLLVGLGWAQDDPVRQYLVPSAVELGSTTEPNPMTGKNRNNEIERGGIDIRHYCELTDLVQGQHGASYEPEFTDVCGVRDDATKKIVYRSDHKPVGVRLRVRF